jgi:hypothetical protein
MELLSPFDEEQQMSQDRRRLSFLIPLVLLLTLSACQNQTPVQPAPVVHQDPLPSWNDTAPKKSIIDFVDRVTKEGGPDFVPVANRIATFDNDGTLWAEYPLYTQVFYAFDQIKRMAPKHPEWKNKQPFRGVIEGDMKAVAATGEKRLLQIVGVTGGGMSSADFAKSVSDWLAVTRDRRFNHTYTELIYQPMIELLASSAPTASRPSSSLASRSASCVRSPKRPTAFPPIRS